MKQKKICSSGGGGVEMCSALMVPAEPSPIPYLRRGGVKKRKDLTKRKKNPATIRKTTRRAINCWEKKCC